MTGSRGMLAAKEALVVSMLYHLPTSASERCSPPMKSRQDRLLVLVGFTQVRGLASTNNESCYISRANIGRVVGGRAIRDVCVLGEPS